MSSREKLRFAMFEVDPLSGELRKHGIRIKLQDQPFKILLALLERPAEVVTRDELRQRVWGDSTFVDFDHGLSAAVNRLREALGDSADRPRYIETMARRGYRFIAPVEGVAPKPAPVPARSSWKLFWPAVALVVAAALGAVLWLSRSRNSATASLRVVRLTAFAGVERHPTFSPDGAQAAFSWNGESQDNFDIYVKMIGSETALRLTSDPGIDQFPAWSPDGRQIAFSSSRGQSGIYLVSPLGGSERKLTDIATDGRLSWSPDGKFLAVASNSKHSNPPGTGAVYLLPVESSGSPRPILAEQPGTYYRHPAFSPDGRWLAVVVCATPSACQLREVRLGAELVPEGEPQPILRVKPPAGVVLQTWAAAWTVEGDSLVASASASSGSFAAPEWWLWRMPVSEGAEMQRLEAGGPYAADPTIAPKGGRLAFTRDLTRGEIWRWKLGGNPEPFLTSSLVDGNPQFSSDGRRIAFQSRRTGDDMAVWVANVDAAALARVTTGVSPLCGTPRWSPDDRWIAFDAWRKDGGWDIWVVEASGGHARRLTEGSADDRIPSWSRSGKWVYFASDRSGRREIWRVPAQTGPAEQITYSGGYVGFEPPDAESLYFTKTEAGVEGLFAIPLKGGQEKQVVKDPVLMRGFSVFRDGIYYISTQDQSRLPFDWISSGRPVGQHFWSNEIRFFDFATNRSRMVAGIAGTVGLGLAVSPDRKTFLFTRMFPAADLMLIESFR